MGIFKSEEEKIQKRRDQFKEKFGLEDLDENDLKILDSILMDLAGTGGVLGQLASIGMSSADMQKVNASWCLVRQNWMILKHLKRIEKQLEELNKKQ